MKDLRELTEIMTKPSARLIADMEKIQGDILILGAGGKVGPSLSILAKRALQAAGSKAEVKAVSLVFDQQMEELMQEYGVQKIQADLSDPQALEKLPDAKNIIYMIGRKFGTWADQALTWQINSMIPVDVCRRYADASIVVFSTGNVYGTKPILHGGFCEEDQPEPIGEYAQSCLARERVFEFFSGKNQTQVLLFRLNYAIDLRYGVLYDIAKAVYEERPVNLAQGVFNCIWQGDVCEYALRSLLRTACPPAKLNVTGPETISIRWAAEEFGKRFGKQPLFEGTEGSESLFSQTTKLNREMGYPNVSLGEMIDWTAEWIKAGGTVIQAPTHFETTDGKY